MAEAVSSLSTEYYAHKRASLLASAALLVVSQPDASFREVSLAMPLTLGPGATIMLEAGLAATTVYYIVHFCTLWFHEAFAFARKEAGGAAKLDEQASSTVAELRARGAELAGRAEKITTAMSAVQQGVILPGDQSASWDSVRQWFENTILEAHLDAIEGTLSEKERRTWTRQFPSGFDFSGAERGAIQAFRHAIGEHQKPEPPFLARVRQVTLQDFQEVSRSEIAASSRALLRAAAGFSEFQREFHRAKLGTKFRLAGLDLLAPVLLAMTALAHYVGDLGFTIAPSLSEILLEWAT